jgi:hypothetical protein
MWLHPTQIQSGNGYLQGYRDGKPPLDVSIWKHGPTSVWKSDKIKIGGEGRFTDGGAIGLWFWYPLELAFYLLPMEDVAVERITIEELEPGNISKATVTVHRAGGLIRHDDYDDDDGQGLLTGNGLDDAGLPAELPAKLIVTANSTVVLDTEVILGYDEELSEGFTFLAPEAGLIEITAEINPAPRAFEESDYGNNILTVTRMLGDFGDLPCWAYSRDIEFELPPASATMRKPSNAWWDNSASGTLEVYNSSPELYRAGEFTADGISGAPALIAVAGGYGSISHTALIKATLHREDFGSGPPEDDPMHNIYADNYAPLKATGRANTGGPVQERYAYVCYHRYYSHVVTGWDYRGFSDVIFREDYYADVYNGIASEEFPVQRAFDRHFKKTATQFKFDLAWEGTHYPLGGWRDTSNRRHPDTVARWMSHMYANGGEDWRYQAPGQFGRTFIGQSTGTITWKVEQSMAAFYNADREMARGRATGKGNYEHAVFATDKLLQGYDWPIKSGYYFNPGGTYSCTVATAQYKDSPDDTQEHKDIVEAVKDAFFYDSQLVYVNKNQSSGTLGPVTEKGGKALGLLKAEPGPLNKTTALLHASTARVDANNTHGLLKEVLEGYGESGTEGSYGSFKYREQTDKRVWLVKEETVITFTLAVPSNQKLYTHVNMKNGEYAVMAKVRKIELEFDEYLDIAYSQPHNGVLKMTDESINLDGIKVTVSGSMYDDR